MPEKSMPALVLTHHCSCQVLSFGLHAGTKKVSGNPQPLSMFVPSLSRIGQLTTFESLDCKSKQCEKSYLLRNSWYNTCPRAIGGFWSFLLVFFDKTQSIRHSKIGSSRFCKLATCPDQPWALDMNQCIVQRVQSEQTWSSLSGVIGT